MNLFLAELKELIADGSTTMKTTYYLSAHLKLNFWAGKTFWPTIYSPRYLLSAKVLSDKVSLIARLPGRAEKGNGKAID